MVQFPPYIAEQKDNFWHLNWDPQMYSITKNGVKNEIEKRCGERLKISKEAAHFWKHPTHFVLEKPKSQTFVYFFPTSTGAAVINRRDRRNSLLQSVESCQMLFGIRPFVF